MYSHVIIQKPTLHLCLSSPSLQPHLTEEFPKNNVLSQSNGTENVL